MAPRLNKSAGLRAWLLVLPLMAFIAVTFIAPLGAMLTRSVHTPVVADALPETLRLLRDWDGGGAPGEAVFAAAAGELAAAREARTLGQVATRINRLESGMRGVLTRTARKLCTENPAGIGPARAITPAEAGRLATPGETLCSESTAPGAKAPPGGPFSVPASVLPRGAHRGRSGSMSEHDACPGGLKFRCPRD